MWVGQHENFISFQFKFLWQKINPSRACQADTFHVWSGSWLGSVWGQLHCSSLSQCQAGRPTVALECHTGPGLSPSLPAQWHRWPVTATCRSIVPPDLPSGRHSSLTLISQAGGHQDCQGQDDEVCHGDTAGAGGAGGGGGVRLTRPSRRQDSEWLRERGPPPPLYTLWSFLASITNTNNSISTTNNSTVLFSHWNILSPSF